MKLVHIFDQAKPTLFAVQYDEETQDEYHRLLGLWYDPEYLLGFFTEYDNDLKYYQIDPYRASMLTFKLANQMETAIRAACELGHKDQARSLQILFKPLNNNDRSADKDHQKTKAKKKWLRLYAVRIAANCFIISGGAIKLTASMDERPHTKKELAKIDRVVDFLKEEGLYDPDDFALYEF